MNSNTLWTKAQIQEIENEFKLLSDNTSQPPDGVGLSPEISEKEFKNFMLALRECEDIPEVDYEADRVISARLNEKAIFTFDIENQRRPGAHHGLGGRPRGPTRFEMEQSICPQVAKTICLLLISWCENGISELPIRLKNAYMDIVRTDNGQDSLEVPEMYAENLKFLLKKLLRIKKNAWFEPIPVPFVSVCFKAPKFAKLDLGTENSKQTHTTCTWVDLDGVIHCTCIGSTLYRIALQSGTGANFAECSHADGIRMVFKAIASAFNVSVRISARIAARFAAISKGSEIQNYTNSLPQIHMVHKGSVIVVSGAEHPANSSSVKFVPVRHITKGSVRNVCAFCDSIINANCHHTRTISIIKEDGVSSAEDESHATSSLPDHWQDSISVLPLSPVNCSRALKVDEMVCKLARSSQPYLLRAPNTCSACGGERNEDTRRLWSDGILMCTVGPCKLVTEAFRCSSPPCGKRITSEGRDQCILMHTISSGATHALLRRELYGVVISNGTLTGRLKHYHSLVTANAFFGIIPSHPRCRSVKTLLHLCSVMLKLMSLAPPPTLFRCNNCECDRGKSGRTLKSLCMDGINQGFLKAGARPFVNISEPCTALKSSTTASRGQAESLVRPLTSLVRESKPIRILFDAIRGKALSCTRPTEKDFACAVTMVSDSAVPSVFFSAISVCGKSRGDVSSDIGSSSVLKNIRQFVTAVFDSNVLIRRLLVPLASSSKEFEAQLHFRRELSGIRSLGSDSVSGEVCWAQHISACNNPHARNDIFNLFRTILQGPVLQFVKRSDTTSLGNLAEICCEQNPDSLERVLANPSDLLDKCHPGDTNILQTFNILQAGVLSVTELERSNSSPSLRLSLGVILSDCKNLVLRFYAFYDNEKRTESPFSYQKRWNVSGISELRRLMNQRYGFPHEKHNLLNGNDYDLAMQTGTYFPGRPQLRPLPFNDEEVTEQQFENSQSCSKDFLQRQKSFTPGALTFCCSCSHPKILGFKVLFRNEGPRAILDTVISRFAVTPNYLIYDFCCGLFISTIHCIWWAISYASVVCDNFHYRNHSCSPGYSPKAHAYLHATNTVSHEQRNRAINKLGFSLRNCKQNLYISLLAYQTIALNIRAQAMGTDTFQNRTGSYTEFDIEWCFFHCLQQKCTCCPE